MDEIETPQTTEGDSFAAELGKAFAISAASTAGMIGGLMLLGSVAAWRQKRREAKNEAKKTTEETN